MLSMMLTMNSKLPYTTYPHIELIYSSDYSSAKKLLQSLSDKGWKIPNYTPETRTFFHYEKYASDDKESAHSVIGQEFDKIVIVIDNYFKYDSSVQLTADNSYYSQRQMLYQIITRTRKELCVVIIDNETILNRCIDILNK